MPAKSDRKPDITTFGLVGKNLLHSWSKSYFDRKLKEEGLSSFRYLNFQLFDLKEIRKIIREEPGLSGLNITIPFKEQIIAYLDEIHPVAAGIGAVNTVRIKREGKKIKLEGFNTDAPAFSDSLRPIVTGQNYKALVLGTGGASKAVQFSLRQMGIEFLLVSRHTGTGLLTYPEITPWLIREHRLIINTTPVGMYPAIHDFPEILYDALTQHHFLYDLVYNPEETLFLIKGKQAGARIKNGLEMLELQAEMSWKIWSGPHPIDPLLRQPAERGKRGRGCST